MHLKSLLTSLVIVIGFGTQGCAGLPKHDSHVANFLVDEKYRPERSEPVGYLIGSMTQLGVSNAGQPQFQSSRLKFRAQGEIRTAGYIELEKRSGFGKGRANIQQRNRLGDYFVLPLKPGRYEFHDVGYFQPDAVPTEQEEHRSFKAAFFEAIAEQLFWQDATGASRAGDHQIVLRVTDRGRVYEANKPFSVAFEISAGEALYLGEVRAEFIQGNNLVGLPVSAGSSLLIYRDFENDESLFRQRFPVLSELSFREFVPKGLPSPLIVDGAALTASRMSAVKNAASELDSAEPEKFRSAARRLRKAYSSMELPPEVFETVESHLKAGYATGDRLKADGMAHLCRLLAETGDQRYKGLLNEVSALAYSSQLRRHAARAYESLEN